MSERRVDVGLGCTVLFWAAVAVVAAEGAERFALPRLTIAALNTVVGVSFLLRSPCRASGSRGAIAACLPSVALPWVVLRLAPEPASWPLGLQVAFALGGALAAVSLLWLSRSFAILPALRQVVQRGPYRLVRHPAYAGQLIMLLACAASLGPPGLALVAVGVAFLALRIRAEEGLLLTSEEYRAYGARVRYRLLPYVW